VLKHANNEGAPLSQSNLTPEIETKIYRAFDKIHELGLVHGDPKAENILVSSADGEPSVWVIDFESTHKGDDQSYAEERETLKELIEEVRYGEMMEW